MKPLKLKMTVKNPDGKERELPAVQHALACEVMEEAKKHYDAAESYRDKDWSAYSSIFHRASRIEDAALKLQAALSC